MKRLKPVRKTLASGKPGAVVLSREKRRSDLTKYLTVLATEIRSRPTINSKCLTASKAELSVGFRLIQYMLNEEGLDLADAVLPGHGLPLAQSEQSHAHRR